MFQKDDVPVLINLPKSLDFADIYFIHDVHFGSPLFDNKKWEILKEQVGCEQMINAIFSYLSSDQLEQLVEWFNQDYDLW